MESYNQAKADYDVKKAEAEAKEKQKQDILDKVNKELSSIYSSICSKVKSSITTYDTQRKSAQDEAKQKMEETYKYLKDYFDSAEKLTKEEHDSWLPLGIGNQNLIDFAISKAEKAKIEIANVAEEARKLDESIVAYEDKGETGEGKDNFSIQMKNQAEKYKAQFKESDIDEIIKQLKATKNYLLSNIEPMAVVPYLKELTFYKPVIVVDKVSSLKKATAGMKDKIGEEVEADIAAEAAINKEYAKQKRDESWDMKKNSVIGSKKEEYYVKKIGEAGFKLDNGQYKSVPAYYAYLKTTCGMKKEDGDTEEDNKKLKNEAKASNAKAKENAEKTGADQAYSYSSEVFAGTPSEQNSENPPNFEELPEADSSNKGTTKQFGEMQGYSANNVNGLKSAVVNEVDNLLISEYIFQNFSFATGEITAKKELEEKKGRGYRTLTNIAISENNNVIYGCEVEYILYGHKGKSNGWSWLFGKEGPECNISNAKRDIFALRFMCNSIFALTDSEIDKFTMPPAMAIQAASAGAVPYQLVQTTFKLALALAEATNDLDLLMKGKKVALLKSKETFVFSPSGVRQAGEDFLKQKIDDGAQAALGAVQTAVDEAGAIAEEKIRDITFEVSNQGTKAAEGALEDIISTIINSITDTIEKEFMKLYTESSEYSISTLEIAINQKLNELSSFASTEVQSFIQTVRSGITPDYLTLVDKELQEAYQELEDIRNHVKGATIDESRFRRLQKAMQEQATQYQDAFTYEISTISEKIANEVQRKAAECLQNANNIVMGRAGSIINKQGEELSKATTDIFNKYFPAETTKVKGLSESDRNVVAEKSFSCSYEDYLRIFLFIKIQSGQKDMLLRIADLIQMNVGSGMKDYGKEYLNKDGTAGAHKNAANFKMEHAYTYVEIESDIRVKPLLMSFELFTPEGEKALKYWHYQYKTIAGY